jgi:pyruvate,water dikinase
LQEFERLVAGFLDVAYGGQRLAGRPELILGTVLEMARAASAQLETRSDDIHADPDKQDTPSGQTRSTKLRRDRGAPDSIPAMTLEQRLLNAVGPERREEAQQILSIGRLSWRLRDDDNVLVGRLESQLLRALELAADRLRSAGRLRSDDPVGIAASDLISQALRAPDGRVLLLPPEPESRTVFDRGPGVERPRQLVGQPASPGLATGRARSVRGPETLARFRAGEVLVCDAIQPTMTHLVPLACAIVERRGGMLIHGAIIARELQIPCVNGVANAVDLVEDGEIVTVDGYLGIVTIGLPEFDLEAQTVSDLPVAPPPS